MQPPTAQVTDYHGKFATIHCPYCGDAHEHKSVIGKFKAGTTYHRAPGCGMIRSPEQRITGYVFTVPTQPGMRKTA